ncbi:MAG: hypothetical protein HYY76_09900 [Acidobacteria bacterium]|nr:hypothetical protein [Acidobacteriota bacterium]
MERHRPRGALPDEIGDCGFHCLGRGVSPLPADAIEQVLERSLCGARRPLDLTTRRDDEDRQRRQPRASTAATHRTACPLMIV